jgi:hypothetical protein
MDKKRDLVIYHPESGAYISLSDKVYLVDASILPEQTTLALKLGATDVPEQTHMGYRLDNYNMGNLFFG